MAVLKSFRVEIVVRVLSLASFLAYFEPLLEKCDGKSSQAEIGVPGKMLLCNRERGGVPFCSFGEIVVMKIPLESFSDTDGIKLSLFLVRLNL